MKQLQSSIRRTFVSLPRRGKQILTIGLDACLLLLAFHFALWLRFGLFFFNQQYILFSIIASGTGVLALTALNLYRYILRYMNERVVLSVMGGVIVSLMAVISADRFLEISRGLSRGVLIIYCLLALVLLLGARLLARKALFPRADMMSSNCHIPVIIYGAGGAGSQLATALDAGPHYRAVAALDDDPRKQGLMMANIRIHAPAKLPQLIERYSPHQLLIAMPSVSRARMRKIVESVANYPLRIRLVPSVRELIVPTGGLHLRDLCIEDLLGRDPVAPQQELLSRCITNRVVMVSGGGGSIGSELCRQIVSLHPSKLVILEISEAALYLVDQAVRALPDSRLLEVVAVLGSVRDARMCQTVLREHGVQTIYHAAAYKHVPIVEHNPTEGILTNVFGTLALSTAALACGVQDFVLISTDKAVRPTNIMGTSKRLAELILQALSLTQTGTRFSMVRFGNVLGSSGSVVPLFQKQILAGGPVTLTHPEITRYFMTITEAAQLVLQAGSMSKSGSVFVLDMGDPVRIADLARRMIHLYGLTLRDEDHPNGDIEILITGLRPGEKLYEELLIGGDVTPTEHPRIFMARERDIPYAELMTALGILDQALASNDRPAIVAKLQQLVPEYQPTALT